MIEPVLLSFLDFKFDSTSGDLFRGGKRLRVPKQTSHLLEIFLGSAGKVITRSELQQLLWPNGEFLDHEQAINRVITDLRAVLRDNPASPKYIETIYKRGYRFLPTISVVPVSPGQGSAGMAQGLPQPEDSDGVLDLASPHAETSENSLVALSTLEAPQPTATVSPPSQAPFRGRRPYRWKLLTGAAVLAGIVLVLMLYRHPQRATIPDRNVVYLGIAPFQSEGPGAEEMGETFRLDLADALSQLPAIQIRAANSLSKMDRDSNSIQNISEKLHLDVLLLGKFRVQDNLCSVEFELVRGRDSVHLASFRYTGRKDALAIIRDKLQRDIFLTLQDKENSLQYIHGSSDDSAAYAQYLQGRELARARDLPTLNQALDHYRLAIERDPRFAQAYAGMASTHLALRYFDIPHTVDHQNQAKQLAQKALQLDPQLAEPHAILGEVAFRSVWDFNLGESELRRASELEPHKAVYHTWLAALLADEGRFEEAQAEIDLAIADDPLWPAVYSMATFVAGVARDNNRMLAYIRKYLMLVPDSSYSHDQLAWAYFSAKRYDDALTEWSRTAELDKDPERIALEARGRAAYRRGGIRAYALVRLEAIERQSPETTRHANDFVPAEWYAFTAQNDKALLSLQRVVANHDREAVQLAVNPMFDNLHDDPRFRSLLSQIGLTLPGDSHRNLHDAH
jgi:DNA-binding winged helix-turn-helix (wHTH) protein/Tfp pilus assembly protein PilF/TolB-like protein